jgi:hypothetical protein
VIGTVEQEGLEQRRVTGDEARAHAGNIGALGKAGEHYQALVAATEQTCRLQAAERWLRLVAVDLRVALVGGDDEVVAVGEGEELSPVVETQDLAGRVAWRADVEQLHALPFGLAEAREVERVIVVRQGIEKARLGAGEIGCPFVDLVEGVRADEQRCVAARSVNDRLGESEQGFARTVHRHHLRLRIEAVEAIAPAQPGGQAAAQFGAAESGRIARQSGQVGAQRILDESRCGVLRLADGQPDLAQAGVWRDVGEELPEFLEGIGLQLAEVGIHGRDFLVAGRWIVAKIIRGIDGR